MFLNEAQRFIGFRWLGVLWQKPNFVYILTDDQDQKDMYGVA